MTECIRIATRQTPLALAQSQWVGAQLHSLHPHIRIEYLPMTTQGDKLLDRPLYQFGGKGMFLKELEKALFDGQADIAVHSIKDVPGTLPEGLLMPVICQRKSAQDVLVARYGESLATLAAGARIGTSSLRRQAQLNSKQQGWQVLMLRGSVNTRLQKLQAGEFDAIVVALAGLERLSWQAHASEQLDIVHFVPAPGQGALGIECREHDSDIFDLIAPLNHSMTADCVTLERALNAQLGGHCHAPIGVHAVLDDGIITLYGFVGAPDGSRYVALQTQGPAAQGEQLAHALGEDLLSGGGGDILEMLG